MSTLHDDDSPRSLGSEMKDTTETLKASATDKLTSSSEKRLNATGDVVEKVKDATEPYTDVVSDFGAASIDLIHNELENFPSSCDILFKALDAVSEVHPFVKLAVLAFKAAINFELTRRSNDRRIFALHVEMKNMMSMLTVLRRLAKDDRGSDGTSIENRLRDRMSAMARDIRQCAETCDAMSKKKLILKVFKSVIWEGKLEAFATCFNAHESALQQDLAMHASLRIETVNEKLDIVLLFRQLQSPAERDLWKFIQSHGGPQKFLESDALMAELRKRVPEDNSDWATTRSELVTELKTDIMEAMDANQKVFARKFEAQQTILLEEMEFHMSREGDRIIQAIRGGAAYERIVDPDVYELWKEMGWKGHVKAKHFVMAIREYFFELTELSISDSMDSSRALDIGPLVENAGYSSPNTAVDKFTHDKWALRYINITKLRPLMEALDDDASSFITVKEVNSFTKARPFDWSLLKWMAYWSTGFPLTLRFYYDRCQTVFAQIDIASQHLLPANRAVVDQLLGGGSLLIVDAILCGLRDTWQETEFVDPLLFRRFKEYVDHEEDTMRKVLHNLVYNLDAPDTVAMVLGQGRPEKRLLPLLYLILDRCLHIIKIGKQVTLHRNELVIIGDSIMMLFAVVWNRVKSLKGKPSMFKLQGIDDKEQFRKSSFGMYYYIDNGDDLNLYDIKYSEEDRPNSSLDTDDSQADDTADALYYGPDPDELDLDAYKHSSRWEAQPAAGNIEFPSYEKSWRGLQDVHSISEMLRSFGVADLDNAPGFYSGRFDASGFSVLHDFALHGQRQGNLVIFYRENPDQHKLRWRYEGTLDANSNVISGRYGLATSLDDTLDRFIIPHDNYIGNFAVVQRPLHYFETLSSVQDLSASGNRSPKDLWRIAYDAVVQAVRAQAHHVPWIFFQKRRVRRRRFLELFIRYEQSAHIGNISAAEALSAEEYRELAQLENTSVISDLRFYRSLARLLIRSQVKHTAANCDGCDKDLRNTRFICLICWATNTKTSFDSVDICTRCVHTDFIREEDGKDHKSSHVLLQLRKSTPARRLRSIIDRANDVRGNVDELCSAAECVQCSKHLEQPFWACVDCQEKVFVCNECNTKTEDNWLSMFMLRNQHSRTKDDTAHTWLHTVVQLRCPEPPVTPPISLDERLLTIEKRLANLESEIQAMRARDS